MNDISTLLSTFYTAFQQRDYASMIACYHPDIHFFDPVFTNLQGKRAGAMWHMLCERGTDLQATFSDIQADDKKGQAHWEATYSFGKNGRLIHNIIDATYTFQDGKIVRHQDSFDLWKWTRMALGTKGVLMGWSGVVQGKVRETAVSSLNKFITAHPEYQ